MKWALIIIIVVATAGAAGYFLWYAPKVSAERAQRAAAEAAAKAALAKQELAKKNQQSFSESLAGVGTFLGSLIPGAAGLGGALGRGVGDLLGPILNPA